jgi:hypothetical protein
MGAGPGFAIQMIADPSGRWHSMTAMRWPLLIGIIGLSVLAPAAHARPPLGDPVVLNIGINCQWQQGCMKTQSKAMKRALKYVRQNRPALWRVQLCNRNAGRQRLRVDWVGFDNCIRNTVLRPIPARAAKPVPRVSRKRIRRLTQTAAPPQAQAQAEAQAPGPGERG